MLPPDVQKTDMTSRHCSQEEKDNLRDSISKLGMSMTDFLEQFTKGNGKELERLKKAFQRNMSEYDFRELWDFAATLHQKKGTGLITRRYVDGSIENESLLADIKAVSVDVGKKLADRNKK